MSNEDDIPRSAVLEQALRSILEMLDGMEPSPHTHELRAKAETYRGAISRWGVVTPHDAQHAAIRDLVFDLHARALADATETAAERSSGAVASRLDTPVPF